MNRKHTAHHRSLGEAHLYVAVAKADGLVSEIERRAAGHWAKKSQQLLDIFGTNQSVSNRIKDDVEGILADAQYHSWSAAQHLDKAVELLAKARDLGDWSAKLSGSRNEDGLLSLAQLDGYVIKESNFLREIKRRLSSLQ